MGKDEILSVHFSTTLIRYEEEFFFLIQKQQNIEKVQLDFLSDIVIINIVKFYKIIVGEIWEHLIIEFKHVV